MREDKDSVFWMRNDAHGVHCVNHLPGQGEAVLRSQQSHRQRRQCPVSCRARQASHVDDRSREAIADSPEERDLGIGTCRGSEAGTANKDQGNRSGSSWRWMDL